MGIIYKDYCVAFIDILGFKEMTSSIDKLKEFANTCDFAIQKMKDFSPNTLENIDKTRIHSLQGADSMFFMFPKEFMYIFLMIHRLRVLQFLLAMNGIYIRGAICSGSIYIDDINKVYFGEAWNKAVLKEKKAQYPRIIIENNIQKIIKDKLDSINEGVMEYIIDDDGLFIIPPFTVLGGFELFLDKEYTEIYKEVFLYIEINAERNKLDKSILQKLYWISKHIEKEQYNEVKEKAKEVSNYLLSLIQND